MVGRRDFSSVVLLHSSSEVSDFNMPENYFPRLFIQNHAYTTLMSHLRDFRDNSLYQLTLLFKFLIQTSM